MAHIKSRKHSLARAGVGAAFITGLAVSFAGSADTGPDQAATASKPQPKHSVNQPAPAAAAAPQSAATTLPELTVTGESEGYLREYLSATKFTNPVRKTPKTIQVIDDQLIEDQQATSLTEALRNSPGVGAFFMGETGDTQTGDAVYMRGVDASGSIFVDGVRDAGNITHDLFNTEQVEVIKGADGSMFGRTSLNGAINLVTKQAHLHDSADVDLSGGTHDQKRATVDINRQLGDTTAVRLNLMGENSGVPGRDKVRNRRWGIAPSISFGLGTDTRWHIDYLHTQQNNQPDGGVPGLGLPSADRLKYPNTESYVSHIPRPDSEKYYGTRSDFDHVKKDQATIRFEKDINDRIMFHDTLRWGRTHHDYMISSMSFPSKTELGPDWDMNNFDGWTTNRSLNTRDQVNTILTNQAGVIQELDTGPLKHTLSYGIELSYETVETWGIGAEPDAPPINIYHPDRNYFADYNAVRDGSGNRGRTTTIAGYLFDTVHLNEHWQFNGGLRIDYQKAKYSQSNYCDLGHSQAPASCTLPPDNAPHVLATDHFEQDDTLFSWQLGTLYQINEHGNVYAQYAVAEEPPGNDGLLLSLKDKYANHPGYDPQKSKTAEIGTKWTLADDRLLLSAAIFRTDIENQVERNAVGEGFNQTGKKRIRGVELSAVGQITANWNVSVGYTRMDSEVVSGAIETESGSRALNYTPKEAFTGWTTYRLPTGLTLGGGARYVGRMERDGKDTHGTPDHISSHWVFDAMAKYPINDNFTVQLNGYNLTNKDYIAAINKKGQRYLPGLSRSVLLSLHMKF